jgi:polygalacturonase
MREGRRPCLWAKGCRDVAISGSGIIDGQGAKWWAPIQQMRRERAELLKKYPTTAPASRPWEQDASLRRPPLVQFRDCINVNIEGVTFQNSPFWTMHLLFSDNVTVRNAQFLAPQDGPNTDAMDIDSCRKVLVEGCHASVGDDAFTLKSGKDEDGRRVGRPTEDVTVNDCSVAHAHGGVVIGSETSGSVRRVRFKNCTFDGTDAGVRIKSARGRGAFVEDVQASDIRMNNVKTAIVVSMRYQQRTGAMPEPVSERTPRFHDILISNVTAHESNRAATIEGLEEMPIMNVTISNFDVTCKEGVIINDADNIEFNKVKIVVETVPTMKSDRFSNIRIKDWTESQRPASTTAPSTAPVTAAAK